MMKRVIRIKKPGKFLVFILLIVVIIAAAVFLPKIFGGDKVAKEIAAVEGQDITVLSKEIKLYQGETELAYTSTDTPPTVKPGQHITFKAVYKYQVKSTGKIAVYPVETGVSLSLSDETLASVTNGNSVVIADTVTANSTLTVTVKYKGLDDKQFTFSIEPDSAATQPDNTDTGGE